MTEAAARARASSLAVPAWAWLSALVVLSVAVRYGLGRRMVAPWIMVDELIYSELAKSVADGGGFAIRGEPSGGAYGVVYPLLIAPAWALFDRVPEAYAAAKAINAAVISLALVPAYLLARRVVSQPGALVVAVLTAALPSLLYAGTLMTENAFFPLFLLAALALVLALERPTWTRTALLLGATGLAFATRAQAVVFVPAMLTAPLALAAVERRSPRRWWRLYAAAAATGTLALAAQLVRGRSLLDLLGAYRTVEEQSYDPREVLRWLWWHLCELDLSLGILPFAAFLLCLALVRRFGERERAFLVGSAVLTAWLVLQVAVFASRWSLRVEERNLFYVAPLFLAALVLWIERGAPRPRVAAAVAAGIAALLPAFVPFVRLIDVSAVSDTFGLLVWWDVHEWGIPLDRLWLAALAAGAAAAGLLLLVPARWAWALPAVLLAFLLVSSQSVEQRIRKASVGALFQGITTERDWIDRAVGTDTEVAALWSGRNDWLTIGQNEFFNRAVGDVYHLGQPLPSGLRQTAAVVDAATGRVDVDADYVLVDETVPVAGTEVASDVTKGMRVVETGGRVRVGHLVRGLYDDGWTGPVLRYRQFDCEGGTLRVRVARDPNLYLGPQRVGTTRIRRGSELAIVSAPLDPRAGRCDVVLRVAPTIVPGGGDTRRLGVRVEGFDVRP
ncbi:MAG TPA: glycosyltransferase family 39 protein [Gaiellaceae bacterium]|nr:glycosyltransferase family 39 protein [Gaiellaceae bacterium]